MSLITPDFGLLFWMTLIFAVVFFILAKFGFPIITSMVDKRSDRINEGLRKAEEAEKALAELSVTQAKMLEEIKAQQAQIIKTASESGERIISEAKVRATVEADKIITEAHTRIEAEKESALKEIRTQVSILSVEIAGRILRDKLSDTKEQNAYIDRVLEEMDHNRTS